MWRFLRKRKIASGIALLLVAFAVWLWLTPTDRPEIIGNISPHDVAQIERHVRHEIWRGTFPDFSLKSIKQLPGNIRSHERVHIKSIRLLSRQQDLHPRVVVVLSGTYPYLDALTSQMFLQKTAKGWEEFPILGDFDPIKAADF